MQSDEPRQNGNLTAFESGRILFSGKREFVSDAVRDALDDDGSRAILVFDDASGQIVDIDRRRGVETPRTPEDSPIARRGRGRPKLGVVAREITLLPRQWDWLAAQPGGASVTIRRLIEEARKSEPRQMRARNDAAYRFMAAIAGDLPGFEEAVRALYAGRKDDFAAMLAPWPADIAAYVRRLAFA